MGIGFVVFLQMAGICRIGTLKKKYGNWICGISANGRDLPNLAKWEVFFKLFQDIFF